MKKFFQATLIVIVMLCFSTQSFASETQQEVDSNYLRTNSRLTNVGFNLKNSMAGFGYNVIISNVFDCVPSYGNVQTWKAGSMRYLRVKPGTTVTITGAFYYRTLFGGVHLKEFIREVYVPHNTKLVVIE